METLKGGRSITIPTADPAVIQTVVVRQLTLRDYEKALLASDDEFELLAVICAKTKEWVLDLEPEVYETLLQAAKDVNENGFFVYAERQRLMLTARINSMSLERLRTIAEKVSKPTQPAFQPRAG